MSSCKVCDIDYNGILTICNKCLRIGIESTFIKVVKSKEGELKQIIPQILISELPSYLLMDTNDMLECLKKELWTPGVVMGARILESQLKIHISEFLRMRPGHTIFQCIKILEEEGYVKWFLDILHSLKGIRNAAMHGKMRFSSYNAIEMCKNVLVVIGQLHNINKSE